ncbi:MAG: peptidylprolyl isomerase [Verrucomicrobiota bacterium]|nr:peptidylprolyl isomerase [Verrucomicrobiota bacterium]
MRALPPDREDQAGKRTFRWRFFLYAIALLYLLGDLYLFQGPLRTRLAKPSENEVSAKALALREGIVATVNGHPIRREELDRAVGEYCLKRGLFPEEIPAKRMNSIRVLVINELVVDRLIWFYSRHHEASALPADASPALNGFRRGITDPADFSELLAGQGFEPGRLDTFLQNQSIQRQWIERVIAGSIVVREEEIEQRYEEEPEVSTVPERIRARHIFIANLGKEKGEAERLLRAAARRLDAGEDFGKIAAELSEDSRSRAAGGELGWFTRERMDKTFVSAVFDLDSSEVSQPFATPIGWHLVEVLERKPQARVSLEEVRKEITAVIEAEKRQSALDSLIDSLKRKATIRYFPEFIWVE